MASTRILLVGLPRMLEEIVSDSLAREDGLEIAGRVRTRDGLARTVASSGADVVVIGDDDPGLAAEVLESSPRVKVLAVAEEGRDSCLYGLSPERVQLGGLSPSRLVRAVRRAVRPTPAGAWWMR